MPKLNPRHVPVLLDEVLRVIDPRPGQTIVDCTLGLGGHSAAILDRLKPDGRLIATDFDPENIADARVVLQRVKGREGTVNFDLVHSNFAALPAVLAGLGVQLLDEYGTGGGGDSATHAERQSAGVDALLADVGVASTQIDDPSRGFSYRRPGPLDMRMDPTRGQPASVLINRLSEQEITGAILELGDETDAPLIARLIVERRAVEPILTTEALTAIICEARDFTLERAAGAKLHPAARTFQALRILVNRELANLERLLAILPSVLKRPGDGEGVGHGGGGGGVGGDQGSRSRGGIAAIITFHSGEDRRVKQAFRDGHREGVYSDIGDEPIVASEHEASSNPRARSAKLRWARRGSGR